MGGVVVGVGAAQVRGARVDRGPAAAGRAGRAGGRPRILPGSVAPPSSVDAAGDDGRTASAPAPRPPARAPQERPHALAPARRRTAGAALARDGGHLERALRDAARAPADARSTTPGGGRLRAPPRGAQPPGPCN